MKNFCFYPTLFLLVGLAGACSDDTSDTNPSSPIDAGEDLRLAPDVGTSSEDMENVPDANESDTEIEPCNVTIIHERIAYLEIEQDGVFEASIEGADRATLYWRLKGRDGAFQDVSLLNDGVVWSGVINGLMTTFAGLEYYVEASSDACMVRLPEAPELFSTDVYGEYAITRTTSTYEYRPDVDGARVVYAREENGGRGDDIVLFDLHTFQYAELTSDALAQGGARISGDNVIYVQTLNQRSDIYLHDLVRNERFRVTNNELDQYGAEIDGHIIVWRDDRNMSGALNGDIYLYDLGPDAIFGTGDDRGEIALDTSPHDQTAPDVHVGEDGRVRLVWASLKDDVDGICDSDCDWNVYFYDFGPDGIHGTQDDIGPIGVTSNEAEQKSPKIFGNRIVWLDARGGNWLDPDIWWLDMGADGIPGSADDSAERVLDIPVDDPDDLAINGDNLVWEDYRGGSFEIYLWDFSGDTETMLTNAPSGQFAPEISGRSVVWQDTRNNPVGEFADDIYVNVLRRSE